MKLLKFHPFTGKNQGWWNTYSGGTEATNCHNVCPISAVTTFETNFFPFEDTIFGNLYGKADNPVSSTLNFHCDPICFSSQQTVNFLKKFWHCILLKPMILPMLHCSGVQRASKSLAKVSRAIFPSKSLFFIESVTEAI
jgi:hypothetical protein